MDNSTPSIAKEAVLVTSEAMPSDAEAVKGYDFNNGINHHSLLQSFRQTGFQATNFGLAIQEVNRMLELKAKPVSEKDKNQLTLDAAGSRPLSNCSIFLGYTSNLISSGVRESIRYVVEHNLVDCIVTTAGGIEEDFIKCLADTYIGDFRLPGRQLRDKGINRIGNLLAPNDNYCKFETWIMPILDQLVEEQNTHNINWTPSKIIARLGKEINNCNSVYYWAYKNNIPVFSPALTDGSIGDMIYFHSYRNPGLRIDIVEDIRRMNSQAVFALNTGMLILGGGLVKHHICNANLMRNGADFSVFVNTANEFDGSDSGARPDEAISWGKIKKTANPVKVYGEASILFPLMVAETFAPVVEKMKTADHDNKRV
ncbi:Deoxyhypusine synthase [Trichoplax sp. H2]|uniref:deoxyhypusine synthase n=1 Tax=Trichoplax adhaerens TaxID=10228 RepID=B3RNI1_TRIAD|nr:hypothetical protein TRIADDRAFT_20912 [Trichoplax adhaerens]EDV28024.1 hypothetical protein TRIADDRAFT_20912 [Trichoplax adhaerens]RDD44394.1 Deoxyhypusine synthase [Trichoplax sp. H2]|eukprot:XP_002109858.1 hypothetical protein TRIADDRAFT_20912 [Trichoplax adhaerens]